MNYKEPEWNAENTNKKQGDTTFKTCGWCEHNSCGSVRYDCHLSGHCSLSKGYGLGDKVYWDTECIIKKLGQKDIESNIVSKKQHIINLEKQIERTRIEIGHLFNLPNINKPPLPTNRLKGYNDGEIVYIFWENKWNRGTVVPGYRSHNGCVSYILDDYPDSQPTKKGPWGCGCGIPGLLKEWEYNYFKENLTEFWVWLALCDEKVYNGEKLNYKEYYNALSKDQCKCTFSQNVCGDGCDACNPEMALEIEKEGQDNL